MRMRAKLLQSCPTLYYELYPARLFCPWDSPGKNTGVGCYSHYCPGDLLYPIFFFFKKKRTALWKTAFCCPPARDVVENKGGRDEVNVWQEFRVC